MYVSIHVKPVIPILIIVVLKRFNIREKKSLLKRGAQKPKSGGYGDIYPVPDSSGKTVAFIALHIVREKQIYRST